jgi:hypothetical protein
MTILIAAGHIQAAVALHIVPRSVHPVVKTTALNFAALLGTHIPTTLFRRAHLLPRFGHLPFRSAREVRDGGFIAAAKAVAVSFPVVVLDLRMTVLLAPVHVRAALMVEIVARGFDSVMKAAALELLQFLRRRIPAAVILTVAGRWWPLRHAGSIGRA